MFVVSMGWIIQMGIMAHAFWWSPLQCVHGFVTHLLYAWKVRKVVLLRMNMYFHSFIHSLSSCMKCTRLSDYLVWENKDDFVQVGKTKENISWLNPLQHGCVLPEGVSRSPWCWGETFFHVVRFAVEYWAFVSWLFPLSLSLKSQLWTSCTDLQRLHCLETNSECAKASRWEPLCINASLYTLQVSLWTGNQCSVPRVYFLHNNMALLVVSLSIKLPVG